MKCEKMKRLRIHASVYTYLLLPLTVSSCPPWIYIVLRSASDAVFYTEGNRVSFSGGRQSPTRGMGIIPKLIQRRYG
jgi:hypothetical protein